MVRTLTTTAIAILVLLNSTGIASTVAQDDERGTRLVCPGGWAHQEWTSAQIAEYEAAFGHSIAEVHPETGNCWDPAGLDVARGWTPGLAWLCPRDNNGRHFGPTWSFPSSAGGDELPPDSATGRCPLPRSVQAPPTELERAAATAVHLTQLEVAGDYDRLYAWMHPDSRSVVPQSVMEGWYREVFAERPPAWMTVDDVRLVEWTWDVTGKVYPSAAEVAFRQRLGGGEETEGIVRLVSDHGAWRWFFGRDRAFVEEQIERYADKPATP